MGQRAWLGGTLALALAPIVASATTSMEFWSGVTQVDAQAWVDVATFNFSASEIPHGVDDVVARVEFQKVDGSCVAIGTSVPYYNEVGFRLVSPAGTIVTLIGTGSYSTGSTTVTTQWAMDFTKSATTAVSGLPASGTYKPTTGSMEDFEGESGIGNWKIQASDTAGGDPLCARYARVTITDINESPTANTVNVSTSEDTAKPFTLSGSDPDNDNLSFAISSQPSHGVLLGVPPSMSYDPDPNWSGSDSFTWTVSDGVNTVSKVSSVTVSAVNDPPIALGQSATLDEDTQTSLTAQWSDPDLGDTHSVVITSQPSHGSASVSGAVLTYVPDANYSGPDTFQYAVNDGTAQSAPAYVDLTVFNINDPPLAALDGSYAVNEGGEIEVSATNSTDIDNAIVRYQFDCENDGVFDADSGSPSADCFYADDGITPLRVVVTDAAGATSTAIGSVSVSNVPPTLTAWSIGNADEAEPITTFASATDPGDDPLTYTWDFGEGTVIQGQFPSFAYASHGTYDVTLTVSDGDGGSDSETQRVVIRNAPPVIDAMVVSGGQEGDLLTFSGSATDPGGVPVSYSWDFDDGTPDGLGASVQHAFMDEGTYSVRLTASDGGVQSSQVETVTITNVAPVIDSITIPTVYEGGGVTLFAAVTDPGDDDIEYTWDFGDGTPTGENASTVHTWAQSGTYTVNLLVSDGDGGLDSASQVVDVLNAAPQVLSMVSPNGQEGEPIDLSVIAIDPGGDAFTITWDFGDGSVGSGSEVQHTWVDEGTYTVVVTVDDGELSSTFERDVVISNVAPSILTTALPPIVEGQEVDLEVELSDPGTDDLTVTWDLGGTIYTGTQISHTYPDDGVVSIVVTVDDGQDTVSRTFAPRVENLPPVFGDVTIPADAVQGDSFSVSASATDVPADTVSYTWDFGDNTPDATGATASHTYNAVGVYTVTVTSFDEDGASTLFTKSVEVANTAPVLGELTFGDIYEGMPTVMSVVANDIGGSPVTLTWDMGDGQILTGNPVGHTYADDGDYTVMITADDGQGGVVNADYPVQVINRVPNITLANLPATEEGETVTYFAVATDVSTDTVQLRWEFSDGSDPVVGDSIEHTWPDDGPWDLTLVAFDEDGGEAREQFEVQVDNLPPEDVSMTADFLSEGVEGTATFEVADVPADTIEWFWDMGVGQEFWSDQTITFAYPDGGTYIINVEATDDDGGGVVGTQTVVVADLPPSISAFVLPEGVLEGIPASFSAVGLDAPGDTLSYMWDFGDGDTAQGATPSHVYTSSGDYTVTLTLTDSDGFSVSQTDVLTVGDVAPIITDMTTGTVAEGSEMILAVQAYDIAGDPLTYSWDFGDGATAAGAVVEHTWADNGVYTVTVTVEDDEGGQDQMQSDIVVTNQSPVITLLIGPESADEGAGMGFVALAEDDSPVDQAELVYTWDFGGGEQLQGSNAVHAFPDDGRYDVTLTVSDGESEVSESLEVLVLNVPPEIGGNPVVLAVEGQEWTWVPEIVDPGEDTHVLRHVGVGVLDQDRVRWTPNYLSDPRVLVEVTLEVEDDDGGVGERTLIVAVEFTDSDGDGIADAWEDIYGLDSNDGSDASLDSDGDGLTALDEYVAGTNPVEDDRPPVPVLVAPATGSEATSRPVLVARGLPDPQGDQQTFLFEVYEDAALSQLVATSEPVEPDAGFEGSWDVEGTLQENATYWWRVRAEDPAAVSDWSSSWTFDVNYIEEPPSVPAPLFPIANEVFGGVDARFQWSESTDPEGRDVSYEVQIVSEELAAVVYAQNDIPVAELPLTATLPEDAWFTWSVRARDSLGVASGWSDPERFLHSAQNHPPTMAEFVDYADGDELDDAAPLLRATGAIDPEGDVVAYVIQASTSSAFDADLLEARREAAGPTADWDVSGDGSTFVENQTAWLRVRGEDPEGNGGPWYIIEVFVRGENDPPPVPELLGPEDGMVTWTNAVQLTAAVGDDPEGDPVSYEVVVATDRALEVVVDEEAGIAALDGQVAWSWLLDGDLNADHPLVARDLFWSWRAVDDLGAASDWAEPMSFYLDPELDESEQGGCGKRTEEEGDKGHVLLWLLVVPLAFWRRRQ